MVKKLPRHQIVAEPNWLRKPTSRLLLLAKQRKVLCSTSHLHLFKYYLCCHHEKFEIRYEVLQSWWCRHFQKFEILKFRNFTISKNQKLQLEIIFLDVISTFYVCRILAFVYIEKYSISKKCRICHVFVDFGILNPTFEDDTNEAELRNTNATIFLLYYDINSPSILWFKIHLGMKIFHDETRFTQA